jgi:opacity protein-like surface antigen
MRKFVLLLAVALAPMALATPASAQPEGPYAGVGYTHFDGEDADVGAITGRLGYRFHPNFGVEGEAGFGVKDDEVGPVTVELDHTYAAYGIGFIPLTEKADVFARVGYHSTEISGSAGPLTDSADADGDAYGAGAQYMITERFGVRGEYTRLEGDDDGVNTWGVGGVMKF